MFRLALAQINPTVGDFEGNLRLILKNYSEAIRLKANLVVFPELALCGYPPEDLLLKQGFGDANASYVERLRRRTKSIPLICGYTDYRHSQVFNSAVLIDREKNVLSYDKITLPNYGVFDERRYFTAGDRIPLIDIGDVTIGLSICEDIWVSPGVSEIEAAAGAGLIINISSSPYHRHKLTERIDLLRDCALRNQCFVAYVNTVGGQDELVFDGGSLLLDPTGKVIARAQQFVQELLIVDLPTSRLRLKPRQTETHLLTESGLTLKRVTLKPRRRKLKRSRIRRKVAKPLRDTEEVYRAVVLGTGDYIRKNGFEQVIIGLSGGVDSALTAAIAVEAIGSDNVHTLYMPTHFSSNLSRKAAHKQAKLLGVKIDEISIEELFIEYKNTLAPYFKGTSEDITEENLQARIRANLLMAYSNKFGYLVLNTGNKSEAAVGYTTLYGDSVGGFAVLKDIPKTLVYKICRHLNRSRKREIIAPEIINRPPSAELKKDQLDSDSLSPYKILDEILRLFVELDLSVTDIVKKGFDRQTVKRVVRMVLSAEYKRRQMPPGVKITPRAFCKDRRWPITNKF